MKEFEIYARATSEALVDSHAVSQLIWAEITRYFGEGTYVEDGYIKTIDYRYKRKEEIVREATEEEIELYSSLRWAADYFSNL